MEKGLAWGTSHTNPCIALLMSIAVAWYLCHVRRMENVWTLCVLSIGIQSPSCCCKALHPSLPLPLPFVKCNFRGLHTKIALPLIPSPCLCTCHDFCRKRNKVKINVHQIAIYNVAANYLLVYVQSYLKNQKHCGFLILKD